ncbi:MAG TPA: hypothetical protein VEW04_06775, partial [Allosphingosinicella sp.]|nr:hypothetical protein [Allosphingosinicella sp.]
PQPPSYPAEANGAIGSGDNGYSTVPPGNSCGSRTVAVDCPGPCVHTPGIAGCTPTTRTCEQVVPGPPCAGPAPPAAAPPAAPKPAGTR